jgi:tRNA nucleotidyltransferase (CCA-adding enzyme)
VGFRFFDHTADVGLEVNASTVSALFEEAAVALSAVLSGSAPVEPRERVSVSLTACSVEQLLVDWLVELLGRFDIELWLAGSGRLVVEQRGDRWHLNGAVAGAPLDPHRQSTALPVKGITYHRLSVRQTADGWRATIVLDV